MGRIVDFFKELFERFQRFIEESMLIAVSNEFVKTGKDLVGSVSNLTDSVTNHRHTISVPGWANSSLEEKLTENKIEFSRQYTDDNIYFVFKNKKDIDYALSLYPVIEKEIEDNYYQNIQSKIVELPKDMRLQAWDLCEGISFSIWENLDDPNKLDLSLPSKEDADFFRTLMNENRLDELKSGKVLFPSVEKSNVREQTAILSDGANRFKSLDDVIFKCSNIAIEQNSEHKPSQRQRNDALQI